MTRPETSALRITALTTHPIQYQAPWFRAIAAAPGVDLQVLFEYLPDEQAQGEGFGQPFRWDVPLLDGYAWQALGSRSTRSAAALARALRGLWRHLREHRPHAVLLTGWQSPLLLFAPSLVRRSGPRCLIRGEANLLRPRASWKRPLHRALLRRYDAFLAIGTANHAFYSAMGVDEAAIWACPYFVDNDRFARDAAAVDVAVARARFGVPEDAVCLLFAGKLEAKKRPLDAVRALAASGRDNLHLLVAGSGAEEARMRELAAGHQVSFAGFVNQSRMPEAYMAADCLVLPSDHGETWGLVVNEAMACGRAAIVSDEVGCATDLIEPGVTGWVAPMGDVPALAACMREAGASRAQLARMGAAARDRVCRHYTVERAAEATLRAARAGSDLALPRPA